MRTGIEFIVLCMAGMALTAAPATAQTTLTVGAFGNDANVLDPHLSGGGQDRALFGYMFNGVMRFAPGSMEFDAIELDLAESVTADEAGLVWTIVLQDGVQFHHGYGELTAEDVAFSLERAADPETSAFAATFGVIDSIEVVDPLTLIVTLEERVPSFEGVLADPSGGLIISRRAVEELGDAVEAPLIGTGPFQFDSYTPGSRTVLTAHADYFRGAPKIDRIDYRYVPSENARELAFAAGEIDLFYGRREQDWVDRMRAQYGETVEIDIFAPSQSRMLHLNQTVEPLDDIRVRQAIAHAIDRDEFQLLVGPDITQQLEAPVPSGFLGQTTDVPRYPHDPEKAKALLAEAGYPDGLALAVQTSEIGSLKVPFELVMEQLRRVGITLEVDFVDHGAWHQLIRQNKSPLVIYGAAPFPQADAFLSPFFLSASIVGTATAQTNFSHCDVADEEIDAARSATDPDQQLELWAEAQRKIMAEVCVVPIFELMQVWGRRNTLDLGYELTGTLNLGPPITEATTFRN